MSSTNAHAPISSKSLFASTARYSPWVNSVPVLQHTYTYMSLCCVAGHIDSQCVALSFGLDIPIQYNQGLFKKNQGMRGQGRPKKMSPALEKSSSGSDDDSS